MIEYEVKGKKYMKPCSSWYCPKHSYITRERYSEDVLEALGRFKHQYWIELPIGDLIHQRVFSSLWDSFTTSLRMTHFKEMNFGYCFFKEIQQGKFHLHGVIVSNIELPIEKVIPCWLKFLKKKASIRKRVRDCEAEQVNSKEGTSKYITKDMNNTKGTQVPPKGWHARMVLPSQGFFSRK